MKKLIQMLKRKYNFVNVANVLAIITLIGSVNRACNWLHYQPEVPEEAKRFRKF